MAIVQPIPSNPRFVDLTERVFGRWTVVGYAGKRSGKAEFLCACSCGTEKVVPGGNLTLEKSTSCGCLKAELLSARQKSHGRSNQFGKDLTYSVWIGMKVRCYNKNARTYRYYGGKGVSVCERWRDGDGVRGGFECFVADMGDRPSMDYTIDRIDWQGNYEPSNCRWITLAEQQRNKSNNRVVEFGGERVVLAEAIRRSGISACAVHDRLRRGWDESRALTQPTRRHVSSRKAA